LDHRGRYAIIIVVVGTFNASVNYCIKVAKINFSFLHVVYFSSAENEKKNEKIKYENYSNLLYQLISRSRVFSSPIFQINE
jgi:hypothetical protein